MYEMMDKMYKMEVSSAESVYLKNSTAGNGQKKSPVNLAIYRTLLRRERDFIPLYHLL